MIFFCCSMQKTSFIDVLISTSPIVDHPFVSLDDDNVVHTLVPSSYLCKLHGCIQFQLFYCKLCFVPWSNCTRKLQGNWRGAAKTVSLMFWPSTTYRWGTVISVLVQFIELKLVFNLCEFTYVSITYMMWKYTMCCTPWCWEFHTEARTQ